MILDQLAELIWVVSQENTLEFLGEVPADHQQALRFEDLVREPRQELARLSAFLGVPPASRMTCVREPAARSSAAFTAGLRWHDHSPAGRALLEAATEKLGLFPRQETLHFGETGAHQRR